MNQIQIPWEAIEGLSIYIIASTLGFVWWMATITSEMKTHKELLKDLIDNNSLYARREDVARELGVIERNQDILISKYDKMKEKLDGIKNV